MPKPARAPKAKSRTKAARPAGRPKPAGARKGPAAKRPVAKKAAKKSVAKRATEKPVAKKAAKKPIARQPAKKPAATRPARRASTRSDGAALIAAARPSKTPQLKTCVAFPTEHGGTWFVGTDAGTVRAFRLPDPREVLELPFSEPHDAWSSASGATYIATSGNLPLVVHHRGRFEYVPGPDGVERIDHLRGWGGRDPGQDTLVCLVEHRGSDPSDRCSIAWRRDGSWTVTELAAGRSWALTCGPEGIAYASTRRLMVPEPRPGRLFRWRDGRLEPLPFPPEEELVPTGAAGLHALPDGRLLALFGDEREWARPWVRAVDGGWTRVDTPARFHGWGPGHIRCFAHDGKVLLPTAQGVFSWDGAGPLRRESAFDAVSLWAFAGGVVARGWKDGRAAHEASRDGSWRALRVPEPETVFGGRGKVVSLAGSGKLPVVKPRLKAPPPPGRPGSGAAAESGPPEPVSLAAFMKRLQGISAARDAPIDVRGGLERQAGTPIAADLGEFFDFQRTCQIDGFVGHLLMRAEPREPWDVPGAGDPVACMANGSRRGILAALTGTVYLGRDAGGQQYFAELHPQRSEVFLYGPGVGEMKFLCESFTAFAELNEVEQRWEEHSEAEGLDDRDLDDSEVAAAPALIELRRALGGLRDRVNLTGFTKSDVESDFDDTMTRLAGTKLAAASRSPVGDVFRRARWLVWLLCGTTLMAKDAAALDVGAELNDPERGSLPATRVYGLWHLYLFGRDAELASLVESCRNDPSGVVRATADLMTELAREWRTSAALAHFRELRSIVRDAAAGHARRLPSDADRRQTAENEHDERLRAFVQIAAGDPPAIAAQKERVAADLRNTQLWDELLFACYNEKRYDAMLAATEQRLSIDGAHYYPWLQKGVALMALGRNAEALDALQQALLFERENAEASAWLNKGLIHAETGDRRQALLHLREALRICPEHLPLVRAFEELAPFRDNPEFRALLGEG